MIKKKVICREDGVPYLIRYSIFSCRWFAVKIHNILISDDACLHDHPWAFVTWLIKGSYLEETPTAGVKSYTGQVKRVFNTEKTLYKRFSILYRPVHHVHRLILEKPVWSLVITFKKQKRWGFFTPNGWVEHFNYKHDGGCE